MILLALSAIAYIPFVLDLVINGDSSGHVQSLIIASILFVGALQVAVLAVLADMMRNLRVVTQQTLERVRGLEVAAQIEPDYLIVNQPDRGGDLASPATLEEALPAPVADPGELESEIGYEERSI